MTDFYDQLASSALRDELPSLEDAVRIMDDPEVELLPLVHAAYRPRRKHFGRKVMVHILNNVQNGLCPEDCGYCSQNKNSKAAIRQYPMKSDEAIFEEAERAARSGASRYCMVLSGRGPSIERTRKLAGLIQGIKEKYPIEVCLSAGLIEDEQAKILADAGLDRLNHNLNTSEKNYEKICSTHTYADRVATLEAARKHGIGSCSGLILGMGETASDVFEIATDLRRLEVPSIPVNFLIPIEGNQVMDDGTLTPERCLRGICLMRFVNPRAEIRIAGGREGHLRGLQALALYAANSLFVDGYLTTRGDATRETYELIRDAGFEVEGNAIYDDSLLSTAADATGAEAFQIPGGGAELLKPEIAGPGGRRGISKEPLLQISGEPASGDAGTPGDAR
jgi:biotin synthase